jgi:hypothetical protein
VKKALRPLTVWPIWHSLGPYTSLLIVKQLLCLTVRYVERIHDHMLIKPVTSCNLYQSPLGVSSETDRLTTICWWHYDYLHWPAISVEWLVTGWTSRIWFSSGAEFFLFIHSDRLWAHLASSPMSTAESSLEQRGRSVKSPRTSL